MRAFAQSAFTISLAAALLVGCGGSQPPLTAPGVTPQVSAHRLSESYQLLYRFHPRKDGAHPYAGLIDVNGTLYGTTSGGGRSQMGTVYSISTSGAHRVLYRFHGGADGWDPQSGLIDVNGTLYGTTYLGGGGTGCNPNSPGAGCGTVYSVTTSGTEKVLHAFKGSSDGAFPVAGLIDVKGTLYGTTSKGGTGCSSAVGCGTVFSTTTGGTEKMLHSFGGNSDGVSPFASLIAVKGTLYGTTYLGGTYGWGTIFSISTSGSEKVLYSFKGGYDGAKPYAGLIDLNGTLYGATTTGGPYWGTVFGVTTSAQESMLHRFNGGNGATPDASLIDVGGTLYGTTNSGGDYGFGIVFSISTSGTEKVLWNFLPTGGSGANPIAGLIEVNATLYGTTDKGGKRGGTVFALTP